ncbi:MAG: hypothetical protein GXP28_02240 [Planctomycetes bacterium]|nr:hypothetical protein [Planctomycetota bacterium]
MPCYLFTYHAYASWLPDRRQGYVKRHKGILEPDPNEAALYRKLQTEEPVEFDDKLQKAIITALLDSREKQAFEVYFLATEPSHAHVLLGWRNERPWLRMRSTVKGSISRSLNQNLYRRTWLAEGGSRKRVADQKHFDYLKGKYLPDHGGWKWSPERGLFL